MLQRPPSTHPNPRDRAPAARSLCHALDADGEILGHMSGLDGLDTDGLQCAAELCQLLIAVQFGAVEQAAGPGEYRRWRRRDRGQETRRQRSEDARPVVEYH